MKCFISDVNFEVPVSYMNLEKSSFASASSLFIKYVPVTLEIYKTMYLKLLCKIQFSVKEYCTWKGSHI